MPCFCFIIYLVALSLLRVVLLCVVSVMFVFTFMCLFSPPARKPAVGGLVGRNI